MITKNEKSDKTGFSQSIPEFVLPASFRPVDFLPGQLALRGDDARWLMSTVLRKTANKDTDAWGCVRLRSDILRRIMGDRHYAPTPLNGESPVASGTDQLSATIVISGWPDMADGAGIIIEWDSEGAQWIVSEALAGAVRVNADDTPAYLEDQFEGHNATPAYESGKDLGLALDTEDAGGGEPPLEGEEPPPADKKLRIFIDASAIAGYDATKEQILTHAANGGFAWVDVDTEECP